VRSECAHRSDSCSLADSGPSWAPSASGARVLSLVPYGAAVAVNDLRNHIVGFEIAFFAAFGLYLLAVLVVLGSDSSSSPRALMLIVGFAILFRAMLVTTTPSLTDDMYRYVWDGRMQALGLNPYAYAPDAPELHDLRDETIWPFINRKSAVTVYPAGAQFSFATLWRVVGANVHGFQAAMATGDVLAGVLLMELLRRLGQPAQRALIYLWSPLAVFETAHAAHVDGLVLPLLVAAWIARRRGNDTLTGVFLGAATSMKLYTGMLLPALWRTGPEAGKPRISWTMPVAFFTTFAISYIPYWSLGAGVIGFLADLLYGAIQSESRAPDH